MIEIKESFDRRFKTALSIRGIKPVDLAKQMGISEATISQYRSGYAKPKEPRLVAIANILGVDPAWLMGLDVPMEPRQKHPGEMGQEAEKESLRIREAEAIMCKLTEENQKRAIGYLEKLLAIQEDEMELNN